MTNQQTWIDKFSFNSVDKKTIIIGNKSQVDGGSIYYSATITDEFPLDVVVSTNEFTPNVVVLADGSGTYKAIMDAVNTAPSRVTS
ncbi:hypothetical protein JCGZ_05136 [Jatropha curcas]|uniref:Pectinesterase n=1 Tax=Jatropha curcas TaxID=180498 RepID=A0A067L4M9_JATCU|nr:hypothetical protein JCGZ_05136 [Jatropha curcas]